MSEKDFRIAIVYRTSLFDVRKGFSDYNFSFIMVRPARLLFFASGPIIIRELGHDRGNYAAFINKKAALGLRFQHDGTNFA